MHQGNYNEISINQHVEKLQYILNVSVPFFNKFESTKLKIFRNYAEYKENAEQHLDKQTEHFRKLIEKGRASSDKINQESKGNGSNDESSKDGLMTEETKNDLTQADIDRISKERNELLEEAIKKVEEVKNTISELNFEDFSLQSLSESALYSEEKKLKKYTCLKELSISPFSLSNLTKSREGDLVYIQLRTLEGKDFVITGTEHGFFVNSSTLTNFKDSPNYNFNTSYTLAGLVCQLSSQFKENFGNLLSQNIDIEPSLFSPNNYYRLDWLKKEENPDYFEFRVPPFEPKSESLNCHIEWNEEWQLIYDLPQTGDFNEKLQRDKLLNDRYIKFIGTVKKGLEYLADKKLASLSFFDTPNNGLFLYDNIFFTLLDDRYMSQQVFLEESQNQTFVGANLDLRHLSYLNQNLTNLDTAKFYFPMACIVTYRGFRVHAQTIIPGIMFNSETMVQYGQLDLGVIKRTESFASCMKELTSKFHISSNNLFDHEGNEFEFHGHPEVKGVLGYDKRKYLFDLVHFLPRDPYFEGDDNVGCLFRPEIIRDFRKFEVETKILVSNENCQELSKEIENLRKNIASEDDVKKLNELLTKKKELIDKLHEQYKGENKLNTCLYTNVKLSDSNPNMVKEAAYLKNISDFIREKQIPKLIKDLATEDINIPADCSGISSFIHKYGVSLRYYGEIDNHINSHPNKRDLQWISTLIKRDVIMRSVKHVYLELMRNADNSDKFALTAHVLNLLLAQPVLLQNLELFTVSKGYSEIALVKKEVRKDKDEKEEDRKQKNQTKKLKKKVKKVKKNFPDEENKQFVLESLINNYGTHLFNQNTTFIAPSEFWELVAKIAKSRFGVSIDCKASFANLDTTVNKFGLLRDFCLKVGIQIRARNYVFDSDVNFPKGDFNYGLLPFSADDVVDFFAVVKESQLNLTVSEQMAIEGDYLYKSDNIPYAVDKYSQAIFFREEVSFPINPQAGPLFRKLANIFYNTSDIVMVF